MGPLIKIHNVGEGYFKYRGGCSLPLPRIATGAHVGDNLQVKRPGCLGLIQIVEILCITRISAKIHDYHLHLF